MNNEAIQEAVNHVVLRHIVEDMGDTGVKIVDVNGKTVLELGTVEFEIKLSHDKLLTALGSPLPVEIPGGRGVALFFREDRWGYAIVPTRSEFDILVADLIFQIINELVYYSSIQKELEFDIAYFKNLFKMMQQISEKTNNVFDVRTTSQIFIDECQKIFATKSAAVLFDFKRYEDDNYRGPEIMAQYGTPYLNPQLMRRLSNIKDTIVVNAPEDGEIFSVSKGEAPKNCLIHPFRAGETSQGTIFLANKDIGPFSTEDKKMVQTLGTLFGSRLLNIDLHDQLVKNEKVRATLGRYLSPNLVKEIIETGKFDSLGGERSRVAILFSDLRGFTATSENMDPVDLVNQLNEYFEEMVKIIFANEGTLDKFVGDLIMVLFGVPKEVKDPALKAVNTAIQMQKRIAELNENWTKQGKPNFYAGIGINIGEVVFGNIGSSQAMGLTVIGDNVNTAQRLEAYAKKNEILISETILTDIKNKNVKSDTLGIIQVKGKTIRAHKIIF